MNKVYVIVEYDHHDYEHFDIIGVFSSKKLAEKEKDLLEKTPESTEFGYFYTIKEFEMDKGMTSHIKKENDE